MNKALSVKFVEFLTKNFGAETVDDMNEFLKTFDAPYCVYPAEELLRYSNFTEEFPLRIETISCRYYIEKDYKDKYFTVV